MGNEFKTARKQWKKTAKQTVRAHYVMFVVLCLIAVFFGNEFSYVKANAQNLYNGITGKPVEVGGYVLKFDSESARQKVFQDLIDDNVEAGRLKAAEQMEAYRQEALTNSVTGRRSGIFAAIANELSSGHLYLIIFGGLHSVIHSTRLATALVVLASLLLSVAVWIFLKNVYKAVLRRVFTSTCPYPICFTSGSCADGRGRH